MDFPPESPSCLARKFRWVICRLSCIYTIQPGLEWANWSSSEICVPSINASEKFDAAAAYNSTAYPPLENMPPRYAIIKRNQWMVSDSDVVISGVTHSWGGAANTLDFAKNKGKVIFQYPKQAAQ